VHGLRHNGCVLPKRANTFVDVLAAGGYATASIGKSHLQPVTDSPPLRKANPVERPVPEAWKPDAVHYNMEEPSRFAGDTLSPFEVPYYGFGHVDMVTSHGDRCGGPYGQWFRATLPGWQALHDPANELPHRYTCPQAYRTPIPKESYPTAWVADKAKEYLEARQ
jgi:arylsulfatase A-like enzyme